ncbi:DNA-dependent RNA polymerase subunit epsilon [Streptococcus sp. DD13]|uniref:DNA-dependent RNA polymerase subunit epsilon n=1 Tax=Streptococcus sp. DD13 TaxID=1777881 RepID=UPI000799B42E|nr:DNA-dependent RNA polymerase subunit epsilon [Streptococcus sp. DD13]KXT77990.1 hypothetical protein STRDD13_01147 [Streptococcus sp. DD13]
MIYKVFYQETKERNPKREQTKSLYVDVDAANELDGRIAVRSLVEQNTSYNIEFIELLSENHLNYEKEHSDFKITEF